jgi:hypothetical protein
MTARDAARRPVHPVAETPVELAEPTGYTALTDYTAVAATGAPRAAMGSVTTPGRSVSWSATPPNLRGARLRLHRQVLMK